MTYNIKSQFLQSGFIYLKLVFASVEAVVNRVRTDLGTVFAFTKAKAIYMTLEMRVLVIFNYL